MGLAGTVVAGVIGATAVGVTALTVPFVSPAFRRVCIPYVPASDQQLANVTALLERCPKPLGKLIDLGSGDGRVVGEHRSLSVSPLFTLQVLECARLGYDCDGVELNRPLVLYSKYLARRRGLHRRARFLRRDIFKTDLSQYDLAILFGTESMVRAMKSLSAQKAQYRSSISCLSSARCAREAT